MPLLTIISCVFLALAILCYLIIRGGRGGREEMLYDRFRKALGGSDEKAAYRAGRAFYRFVRKSPPRPEDTDVIRDELKKLP